MDIRVISCGGTIDKVYFDAASEFEVGESQTAQVFADANVTFDFEIESLMRKDSLEMTSEDRALIRRRVDLANESRILITHGTDTMHETAEALIGVLDKVVVLTGSMVPARFRTTDAIFNLGCAIGVLQSCPPGVFIAMNGQVFEAGTVRKNREELRFEKIIR